MAQPSTSRKRNLLKAVFRRDGAACVWCGGPLSMNDDQVSLDHVIPQSCGGSWFVGNLVAAHKRCNERRGNTDPLEWAARCAAHPQMIPNLRRIAKAISRADSDLRCMEWYHRIACAEQQAAMRALGIYRRNHPRKPSANKRRRRRSRVTDIAASVPPVAAPARTADTVIP